ncbi:hypothetical protein [Marivirga sp.]|uniref:hypothetical protein n=1 Tax=Marivirga sp. TaxID=2018662 RepID=UPI003DA7A322
MALTYNQIKNLVIQNTQPIIKRATKLKELFLEILEFANSGQYGDLDLEYDPAETYGTAEAKKYVEYINRLWKAKQASFSGQAPPTDINVDQNFYWEVVSESEVSGIKAWQDGLFGSGLIVVDYQGQLYKLDDNVTRPFESTDFAAELANGDWEEYYKLYPIVRTGSEIAFDRPAQYGTDLAPLTVTTLTDTETAAKNLIQKIYIQAASFSPPASWQKLATSEDYDPAVVNIIIVERERSDRKIYSITKDA